MKILVVTNLYPHKSDPSMGIFVKEQVDSIKKQGVDILFINGRENRLNYLKGIFQVLRKSLVNKKYALIHAHYGFCGIIARSQWRYPLIVSFHGSDVNLSWQGFLSKILARYIQKSIVMTNLMKTRLSDRNAKIIPCGVNFKKFRLIPQDIARQKLGLTKEKNTALFPASPRNPLKRYDLFVASMNCLRNRGIEIDELILSNVLPKNTPIYYNASDVLVLTSDTEGSPMVIKEAMACNLPIVSVDVGDVN